MTEDPPILPVRVVGHPDSDKVLVKETEMNVAVSALSERSFVKLAKEEPGVDPEDTQPDPQAKP